MSYRSTAANTDVDPDRETKVGADAAEGMNNGRCSV
jgi:hypothetical protein